MTLLEVTVTIAILGALALIVAPAAGKIIRRSQTLAASSSMRQVLATARLQAVKRGVPVVVQFSLTPESKIQLHTFQDRVDKETPLTTIEQGQVGNFIQDVNEPTLGEIILPSAVVVWKYPPDPAKKNDPVEGFGFDGYNGVPTLTDRVAFLPTGGIAPPEDTTTSSFPDAAGGRGVYFADSAGKNFFRVTVDSDISGRIVVDKYQDDAPAGYRASKWTWY